MINKKAQLDKIITTLPVLILIFIIMGIFIILATSITLLGDSPSEIKPHSSTFYELDGLLTKPVQVKLSSGQTEEMMVLDAFLLATEKRIEQDSLREELKKLLKEEGDCVLLGPFAYIVILGKIENVHAETLVTNKKGFLNTLRVSYKDQRIITNYFYGKCDNPHEEYNE